MCTPGAFLCPDRMDDMSCITVIGRRRYYEEGCDDTLPRSTPEWTTSKRERLARMMRSQKPSVRAVAAMHPRLPLELMRWAVADEAIEVRRAAIKNPTLPNDLVAWMSLADEDAGIRAYARLMLEDNE